MKINMFKFYKTNICFFTISGILLIVVPLVYILFCANGNMDDYFMLYITFPVGFGMLLFPILIYYKQLIHVSLTYKTCISYSFLRKKLCQVNYDENVFYSFFDVKFIYAPPVRFIALSNTPLKCEQNPKSVFVKGFYGSYDQKQIVIFPYDDQVAPFLNLDNWRKIN